MQRRARMVKVSFPLIFLLFYCINAWSDHGIASDEVSALLAIKSELDDQLDVLHDWRSSTADGGAGGGLSHCNWTGVRCNSRGFVDGLDLSNMNMSGRIADNIAGLPNLVLLNLCCNELSSALPAALVNLTALRDFDVSDNNFVGRFPGGIGAWPELTSLNTSANNFEGPLPDDIGNVAAPLEMLDLRGNFFMGSIPTSYKFLRKLKFLGLAGNNLTGELPREIGQLSSLETAIIGYNGFEGSIPAEIGNLSKLRYLDMAIGNFAGVIPPELGKLESLTTVYLYKNSLDGEIPKELGGLTSLQMLDLSDNQLSGSIPPELAKSSNLQLLNLMCNKLSGAVPAGIGELPQLEVLELWNNSLSGPLPANLGRSSPLQLLDVSTNALSGDIPDGLCEVGNLTKLILFSNGFSGPIPASLSTCQSLVRVRIQNNRLNGTIPAGLGSLPKLQRLELAGNELSGEIPDDISMSASLSFIDLSHNKLKLSLPSNILSMAMLQNFLASDNELTGGIPDDLQSCQSLAALDLSNNHLSGIIPSSLTLCERLVTLSLQSNQLTGEIPPAIAQMPTLSILDLSNNFLTGQIPDRFGSSQALEMLNLAYNNLSGEVPAIGLLKAINPDDLAGNSGLCGGVLPPCGARTRPASPPNRPLPHIKHIAAGWLIGILTILTIVIAVFGARRLYKRWGLKGGVCCGETFDEENASGGAWPWRLTAFQRLNFTSADVLACVKDSNIVGMGATGVVYKADLQKRYGVTVAVKKIWHGGASPAPEPGSDLDSGDFETEVNLLGRLRHRNIVRMLGYLRNDSEMMILYEYMQNHSLWEALHGDDYETVGCAGRLQTDWVARYNVAHGIAAGLAYLHHDCRPTVIHRDVKSSNVLLDGNLEAKIADFGLARTMLRKKQTVSSVAGSFGYMAPEYAYTLKVDQKSDTYSFGVVLMELLTGKKPIQPEFGECGDIVEWVRHKLRTNHRIEDLLDANVGGRCQHVREEMLLVLRIAVLCTAKSPKDRPSMRDVLTMLAEARPRRKSSSVGGGAATVTSNVVAKDKPVFTTSPDPDYL